MITSMEEKPGISYLINTGMYVVNPSVLEMIPSDELFHMPWLAQKVVDHSMKVGMYPVAENSFWDMGNLKNCERWKNGLTKNLISLKLILVFKLSGVINF